MKTLGVWLPIALADILRLLVAVCRRAGGDTGEFDLLKRSKVLESWPLPIMSEACRLDEEEQEAMELLRSVQNLAKRKTK